MHSTTKYMDGHALQMGGVIVDGGTFDWTNGKFPEFTEPDDSYHGTIYTQAFGKAAYIVKARTQMMRDMGACPTPFGAFLINQGLETLPLRIERHSQNADAVAHWLEKHKNKIESVSYPTLEGNPYKERAAKYLPNGCSGVISFSLKGGREAGARFIDSLKMASLLVHVADIRTCVLHPASSTHRQLTDEQLVSAGITPGMVRLSVGIEEYQGHPRRIWNRLWRRRKLTWGGGRAPFPKGPFPLPKPHAPIPLKTFVFIESLLGGFPLLCLFFLKKKEGALDCCLKVRLRGGIR